jgi:hypothetical protein
LHPRLSAGLAPFRRFGVLALFLLCGALAPASDEFLRSSERDLSPRERAALDEFVTDLGNPDPVVRNRALRRVAAVGRASVPALAESLHKANDPKLLRNLCLTLGTIDDPASFALLEKLLAGRESNEDVLRAALVASGRGRGYPSPELADAYRRHAAEGSLATVREAALLASGARKLAGLGDMVRGAAAGEKLARVRGCILVALAEAEDATATEHVARALDPKRTHDEMVRRAALYAAARSGAGPLLDAVLKAQPDAHELPAWCIALGAFEGDAVVEALARTLKQNGAKGVDAVWSLARLATPAGNDVLKRATDGEFGDVVEEAACLAVAPLVDEKRFVAGLRTAAAGAAEGPKAAALLSLARYGDGDAALAASKQLAHWKDPRLLTRGMLLCATLETPIEQLLPEPKTPAPAELWRLLQKIQKGIALPTLRIERLHGELTQARAHWLLRRDDLRTAVVHELLELDKVVFTAGKTTSGGTPPAPPDGGGPTNPGGPGGDGSGGSGSGGSGSGSGSGDGSGAPGGPPTDPGTPPGGGDGGKNGFDGLQGQRRGKPDTARFELDLRQWLEDFPLFPRSDPFGG